MKYAMSTAVKRRDSHLVVIRVNHLVKSAGMINLLNCLMQLLMNDFALFE